MNQVELKQLYAEVFDTNGNVKVCGRQSCIDLIDALEYVTGTRDVWGNIQTGAMNIDKINSYFKSAA